MITKLNALFPAEAFRGTAVTNGLVLAFGPDARDMQAAVIHELESCHLPFLVSAQDNENPEAVFARGFSAFQEAQKQFLLSGQALCCFVLIGTGSAAIPTGACCRSFQLLPTGSQMDDRNSGMIRLRLLEHDSPQRQICHLLLAILLDPSFAAAADGLAVKAEIHHAGKQFLSYHMLELLRKYLSSGDQTQLEAALKSQLAELTEAELRHLPQPPLFSARPISDEGFRMLCKQYPAPFLGLFRAASAKNAVRPEQIADALYGPEPFERVVTDHIDASRERYHRAAESIWAQLKDLLEDGAAGLKNQICNLLDTLRSSDEEKAETHRKEADAELKKSRNLNSAGAADLKTFFIHAETNYKKMSQYRSRAALLRTLTDVIAADTAFWNTRQQCLSQLHNWRTVLSNYLLKGLQDNSADPRKNLQITWKTAPEALLQACRAPSDAWDQTSVSQVFGAFSAPPGLATRSVMLAIDDTISLDASQLLNSASALHPQVYPVVDLGAGNMLLVWFYAGA